MAERSNDAKKLPEKEEGLKLFGEDGLIFDHTNPLDYLSFVPGIGVLGIGAKALSTLNKTRKLDRALGTIRPNKYFPTTQYHSGHSSVQRGAAGKVGIYSTPDYLYSSAFLPRSTRAKLKYGPTGVYKLDLSKAKNVVKTDMPPKKLKKAIEKQIKEHPEQRKLNNGLEMLFKPSAWMGKEPWGVRGSAPLLAGREALDWLRKQGVEVLTDSKTLKRGKGATLTDSEYFLLKDFPKKKLSKKEIADLEALSWKSWGLNEGGRVSGNLRNFLNVAGEVIEREELSAMYEMPENYREGGRTRLI